MNDNHWLDGSLYPDMDPPDTLDTLPEQVDFLARLCAAWDFGILPEESTVIGDPQTRMDSCRRCLPFIDLASLSSVAPLA